MDTYLFDTNVISALLKADHPRHLDVETAIGGLDPDSRKYISAVTLGELEFGFELAKGNGLAISLLQSVIADARKRMLYDVTHHTAKCYGEIKTAVALKFQPRRARVGKGGLPRWPTQWTDEFSGERLQVDENDLWIAAQALERNLVLFTTDKGMERISEAVPRLRIRQI